MPVRMMIFQGSAWLWSWSLFSFCGALESWPFGCCLLGVLGCNRLNHQRSSPKDRCLIWELEIRHVNINFLIMQLLILKASLNKIVIHRKGTNISPFSADWHGKYKRGITCCYFYNVCSSYVPNHEMNMRWINVWMSPSSQKEHPKTFTTVNSTPTIDVLIFLQIIWSHTDSVTQRVGHTHQIYRFWFKKQYRCRALTVSSWE